MRLCGLGSGRASSPGGCRPSRASLPCAAPLSFLLHSIISRFGLISMQRRKQIRMAVPTHLPPTALRSSPCPPRAADGDAKACRGEAHQEGQSQDLRTGSPGLTPHGAAIFFLNPDLLDSETCPRVARDSAHIGRACRAAAPPSLVREDASPCGSGLLPWCRSRDTESPGKLTRASAPSRPHGAAAESPPPRALMHAAPGSVWPTRAPPGLPPPPTGHCQRGGRGEEGRVGRVALQGEAPLCYLNPGRQ